MGGACLLRWSQCGRAEQAATIACLQTTTGHLAGSAKARRDRTTPVPNRTASARFRMSPHRGWRLRRRAAFSRPKYGMMQWGDLFSARQNLAFAVPCAGLLL